MWCNNCKICVKCCSHILFWSHWTQRCPGQLSTQRCPNNTLNSALSGTSCYAKCGSKVHSYYWYKNKSRSFLIFAENICIDIPTIYITIIYVSQAEVDPVRVVDWWNSVTHQGCHPACRFLPLAYIFQLCGQFWELSKETFFVFLYLGLVSGQGLLSQSVACHPTIICWRKNKQFGWLIVFIFPMSVVCLTSFRKMWL